MLWRGTEVALMKFFFQIDFLMEQHTVLLTQLTASGLLSQQFTFAIFIWILNLDFLLLVKMCLWLSASATK